jgi:sigma-B regulation protein RsbU (phosphoserine phosphatase)
LFEQERDHTATLETLTEIAREVAAILDLDELLSRIAILTRRVIDYRTFGILLVNEATNQLEPKVALQYGERTKMLTIDVGSGLVGYAALHKEIVLVDDVSADPRYISVVDDVRSELVIPLLLKDRCIGVSTWKARNWRPSPSGMLTCCASWPARLRSPSTMRGCTKR